MSECEKRAEIAAIRSEIAALRAETNSQFAAQRRTGMQFLGGMMMATNVIGFTGVIVLILTQV